MKKIVFVAIVLIVGCGQKPQPLPAGTLTSDAVKDDDTHRDFVKVWHLQITPDVQMNVTTTLTPWLEKCRKMFGCGEFALRFSDELKQNDDAWVAFNCDKVAEKIIDRDLVAKVEGSCKSIHTTAEEYWKNNADPSEFTDSEGHVWKRQ